MEYIYVGLCSLNLHAEVGVLNLQSATCVYLFQLKLNTCRTVFMDPAA